MNEGSSVDRLVESIYRDLFGQLTATLTRIIGFQNVDLAEAIVQDAFLKALEYWPSNGIPANPAGWVTTVAKNLARDALRRQAVFRRSEEHIVRQAEAQIERQISAENLSHPLFVDDRLRMMLLASHPTLSKRARLSLTLKMCSGFTVSEIARGMLANEESIRKLIHRSKVAIRQVDSPFEWPDDDDLSSRTETVLDVLYLMFNEGYLAFDGNSPIRSELCEESIRLVSLFLRGSRPLPHKPATLALLALMLFHSARFAARVDADGEVVLLEDQDRGLWDKERIRAGLGILRESFFGDSVSRFHHEAQIAAIHAVADDVDSTDWARIVFHYEQLFSVNRNPVIALNRAVALSYLDGPEAGLREIEFISGDPQLVRYHIMYAAKADLYRRLGKNSIAADWYRKALEKTTNRAERRFIETRIRACSAEPNSTADKRI